jgi:capsular polysaccharide export protein
LKQHSVPQSKSAANVEYLKNIYDVFGFQFKNLPQTEPILTKEKLVGKYLRKILKLDYDNIDLVNTKYLFFPMQVNKDAQLILNSKVGNIDALKIANKTAKEKGLKLIVKPHPGEVEFGFIKKVNTLKEKLGFAFVKNNTIELIKNAEKVVTINSTVGLQAKIAGKKVTCLGNAFYQDFDERKLAAYTQSYLIDADFWDEGKISLESAEKILNRVEIN